MSPKALTRTANSLVTFSHLIRLFPKAGEYSLMSASSAIGRAIDSIKRSWRGGKTLKSTAGEFGIDPGNLARAFRQREGMTVKQYIDQKRKNFVEAAIRHDELFGYEVGEKLGFPNDLAFYRWVKRAFGVSFKKLSEKWLDKKE